VPCKISGDPKRPCSGCSIFYLQTVGGEKVGKGRLCLYAQVEKIVLQIRDDHHHEMNRYES